MPADLPSPQTTNQDLTNARTRQAIAGRQAQEYAQVLAWAQEAFGPGWVPSHRHFLIEKECGRLHFFSDVASPVMWRPIVYLWIQSPLTRTGTTKRMGSKPSLGPAASPLERSVRICFGVSVRRSLSSSACVRRRVGPTQVADFGLLASVEVTGVDRGRRVARR
jgi:hypothetical protein